MAKGFLFIAFGIVLVLTSLLLFDFRQQDLGRESGMGLHQVAGALEAYRNKSLRPGAPPAAIQRKALQTQNADGLAIQKIAESLADQAQSPQGATKPQAAASTQEPELVLTAVVDQNNSQHVDPRDDERIREIMNSTMPSDLKAKIYEKYLQTGVLPEVKWVAQPTPAPRAPASSDDPYNPNNW
ncbi:MAG TPA: hypothetical protein PLZ57_03075 [Pseudobdellovibrionaceae bacterium]|nr:hypothetical protein [Pseudobdellovibrionaceae bacterium]